MTRQIESQVHKSIIVCVFDILNCFCSREDDMLDLAHFLKENSRLGL